MSATVKPWMLAGHVVVGRPRGRHGPVRRRPLGEVVYAEHWGHQAVDLLAELP